MKVKEALEIIKPGSLIIPKYPNQSGREREVSGYNTWTNSVPFPSSGLTVREIKLKKAYDDVTSYELLFEGKGNNFYITHSEIDFEKSKLGSFSRIDQLNSKIESIESSISLHEAKIYEHAEKIEIANRRISNLKDKIALIEQLGDDTLDDDTLEAYALVKTLRKENISDLEAAKSIAKFLK